MKNSIAILSVALTLSACASAPKSVAPSAELEKLRVARAVTVAAPAVAQTQSASAGTVRSIPLQNPSFNTDASGKIAGWTSGEHGAGNSYSIEADPINPHSGPSSIRIRRHGKEPFALLDQSVGMHPGWRNKTLRLSGWLKGEGISGVGGALVIRADGGSGQILGWNFMDEARVTGTQAWKLHSIDLKVPPESTSLRVGVMLQDGGTLWADDLRLELID